MRGASPTDQDREGLGGTGNPRLLTFNLETRARKFRSETAAESSASPASALSAAFSGLVETCDCR
jgi:hypothetical protein